MCLSVGEEGVGEVLKHLFIQVFEEGRRGEEGVIVSFSTILKKDYTLPQHL